MSNDYVKTLGQQLKRTRDELGLSLRAASKQIGVSYSNLSRIENGSITPDTLTAQKICRWLGISLETLLTEELPPLPTIKLPYYTGVAAGSPSLIEGEPVSHLNLSEELIRRPAETIVVRAMGDSMIGENIFEDDLLVVERIQSPEEIRRGNIVVADVNGQFCVKTYDNSGDYVVLRSANPNRPDIELTGDKEWRILGRVLHSIHRH